MVAKAKTGGGGGKPAKPKRRLRHHRVAPEEPETFFEEEEETLFELPEEEEEVQEVKKPVPAKNVQHTHLEIKPISLPYTIKFLYFFAGFWEWFVYGMVVTSYALVTYVSIFSFYQTEVFSIVLIFDILFAMDTLVRVLVELWRFRSGVPCIVFVTPYTFFQYLLDMISIVPAERFFIAIVGTNSLLDLTHYDLYRYNRFLRFSRVFKFLGVAVQEGRISEKLSFLLKYMTVYLGFIQFVSCVFYVLLPLSPVDFLLKKSRRALSTTWLGGLREIKPDYSNSDFDHFVLCSGFSTAVVTTTGYGDLSPKDTTEMLFGVFVMLVGAILLTGMFTSGLTSFELEQDGARFDLFFRVKAIMAHLHYIKASQLFRLKVSEYYKLLWNYREGNYTAIFIHLSGVYDAPFLFDNLPTSMKDDMSYDICQEMFHLAPLFRNLEESLLRSIAKVVEVVLYNPDMILCAGGSYAINMFYIIQGECRVKSKFDPNFTGSILRAGCLIGELNLFFSFPYTTTIETKTCCQLLKIKKEDLFGLFEQYPTALGIFRERVEARLTNLRLHHELIGEEPISWVSYKDDLGFGGTKLKNDRPISMRRGHGLNTVVDEDVIDDTDGVIIIGMPCLDKQFEKQHTTVYQTCVIPPILTSEERWVQVWIYFILVLTLYGAFIGPYCRVFQSTSEMEQVLCNLDSKAWWILSVIFFADCIIEVTQCIPVVGFYYKLNDGLKIKITQISFWLDLLGALPWAVSENKSLLTLNNALRAVKLWKIIRYFNYLDNTYPNRLFYFRLFQTALVLLYGVHFLACLLFGIACPLGVHENKIIPICGNDSWLRSYQVASPFSDDPTIKFNFLGEEIPYLVSFYFSSATLTSAGFGDFSPQTREEMLFMIVFELISFSIIGYYTALLTSALSCTVRPKLVFQQKLFAIRQFMDHHGLDENLQQRVVEHYYLQDHLWSSVNLPPDTFHMMYDTPDYLHEDALYMEVENHFDGVPIFTKLDPKPIVTITKLVRRYLIPPGSIFLRKGEVRRQMYVIGRGSVAILADNEDKPLKVLEATAHFGIRDLMFGEPAHHHIKTLSYCLLYEIELRDLNQVFDKDSQLKEIVDNEKEKLQKEIDLLTKEYSKQRVRIHEKVMPVNSWLIFPRSSTEVNNHCTLEEFDEVFERLRCARLYYLLLLRQTIHPAGNFAKAWSAWMSLVSALTILFLVMESFIGLRAVWLRYIQMTLSFINFVDIYVHLHWGYYNEANVLISHPVKTAINYVFEGSFVYDIVFSTPFELIIGMLETRTSHATFWYSKLRWTRVGQILRIPSAVQICHNIFKFRSFVLLGLYVSATLILSTGIGGIAAYIACPATPRVSKPGDGERLPYCMKNSWAYKKESVSLDEIYERWVFGVYYVSQVILVIGFGDMITLRRSEVFLMIFMMIFGFIIMRCVVADITAAEVDIDEVRARYLERKKCIELVMARENVNYKLVLSVREHLTHNWAKSKGLQPRRIFADLHPALEADLFRDFVGEQLKKVPVFSTLTENVVRTLCQFMTKLHFLKGERLMRYGNLEFEMYIIVEGKVWIMNGDNQWYCTLKTGQSFGEASMVHGLQRKYTAVAGSSVEVFVLTSQDFNEVLERYPVVRDEITKKLGHGTDDIFEIEKRISKARKKLTPQQVEWNEAATFLRTSFITHLLEARDHPDLEALETEVAKRKGGFLRSTLKSSHRGFVSYGPDDDHLAFLYFASRTKEFSLLLHPKCGFMRYYSELVVWLCFLTCCLAAYEISFSNDSKRTPDDAAGIGSLIPNIALTFEFPLYFHIIFEFFTPFLLYEGQYCKERKPIAFNYITSFTRFPIDLIASLPVYIIVNEKRPWAKFLYLVRFLRLVHFYRSQLKKKYDLAVSTFRYKITISLSSFLLMAHGLACFFYFLSPCTCPMDCEKINKTDTDRVQEIVQKEMCVPKSWTSAFVDASSAKVLEDMAPWRWYVRSIYWVVTTVSTTGFGDITSQTASETLVAIACIFCGAFVLSIILSHFTSGAASLSHAHREYFYRVNLLAKYQSNLGMSREKRDLLMSYFLILWDGFRGLTYHDATDILPLTMKIEVCYALMFSVVKKCKLFQGVKDKSFLRQVCASLVHTIYLSGTNIVNEGDQGDEMFIVFKGRVSGFTKLENGKPLLKKQYNPGTVFGKLPALFYDQKYTKFYRTEMQSEVLSLKQDTIIQLMKFYPQFERNIKYLMLKRYEPRDDSHNIFQDKMVKTDVFEFANLHSSGKPVEPDLTHKEGIHQIIQKNLKRGNRTPAGQPISFPKPMFKIVGDVDLLHPHHPHPHHPHPHPHPHPQPHPQPHLVNTGKPTKKNKKHSAELELNVLSAHEHGALGHLSHPLPGGSNVPLKRLKKKTRSKTRKSKRK